MKSFGYFRKEKAIKFCKDRRKGAEKIAKQVAKKNGVAKLTEWHFEAKLPEYDECIKIINQENVIDTFVNKIKKFTLSSINANNQKGFQEAMGKLEVWGEVYLFLKSS
jgi:hypothetical protein